MSKENNNEQINETISNASSFLTENKTVKYIIIGLGVVLLAVATVFAYKKFVSAPKAIEASEQIYQAQKDFAADSFSLALNGGGITPGFLTIIDQYGSTPSGNLACFYAGTCYLNLGEYENAITYFEKFDSNDEILGAKALSNIGDCYVELKDNDNALKYFTKAADKKDNNMAAKYLSKAAAVYEEKGEYNKAVELYTKIKTKYHKSTEAGDIDKYIERAKTLAASN